MVDEFHISNLNEEMLARLVIEFWRLTNASSRAAKLLPEKDGKRFFAQIRFSELQLETISTRMGLSIVCFDGDSYSAGIAASADNGEDYIGIDELIVVRTIEPAIVQSGKILQKGRVHVGIRNDEKSE